MSHTYKEYKLWYDKPAKRFEEALPLGNGRLGAMVYGNPDMETINVNEDTIWSGGPMNRNNKDSYKNLDKIRKMLIEGSLEEAQELAQAGFSGTPDNMRFYQTAGDISIVTGHSKYDSYKRELDINKAVTRVEYICDSTKYIREMFISNPDNMFIMRFTCEGSSDISMKILLSRNVAVDEVYAADNETIALAYHRDIAFCNMLTCKAEGGEVYTLGCQLIIKHAKEVILYFNSMTSYREYDYVGRVYEALTSIKDKAYDELLSEHIKDYQSFFNRTTLSFSSDAKNDIPTDVRLSNLKDNTKNNTKDNTNKNNNNEKDNNIKDDDFDMQLLELHYHFGRYLLISSSRSGTMPANLQGIWNNSMSPPWGSKYTININIQMNYWFAEMLGLSELHMPLFDLFKVMHKQGIHTAKKMYNCKGFVAHHNTDIWGDCAPQDYWLPGTYWVLSGAWFCLHAFEHYEYTEDKYFLNDMFPVIKDACIFYLDFLSEDGEGNLVISPTASPENCYIHESGQKGYLSAGCTMDTQILTEFFNGYIKVSKTLSKGEELIKDIEYALDRMPKTRIAGDGSIAEWFKDYEEVELGHRHISHLFGLHPGILITPDETKELADAARKTLEKRLSHGGGHTGWSRAWIINFYAKLFDGDEAFNNAKQLLIHSTLPNLFDNHPPFQIDGNFGGTAGIANMLMQNRGNKIYLLPALPLQMPEGSLSGFRARNNISIDFMWKDYKVDEVTIVSDKKQEITIITGGRCIDLCLEKGDNRIILSKVV